MIGKRLIPLAIFLIFISSCSGGKYFNSYWNNNSKSDIFSKSEAHFYHASDKISIKVFNDDKFVDIVLETNSPITLQKIYNLGLSVWIDPNGHSKNVYAVNYPLPVEFPFTDKSFRKYINRFSIVEFQEELMDRFQAYETIDTRINESILLSTINKDEAVQVYLSTNNQVLYSSRVRIPIETIYPNTIPEKRIISIGISSVNEANEEYFSALTSKEYINKRLDELKAGAYQNKFELEEWWVNFQLEKRN